MYLDNPKKLFDDLINIPTMYDYMVACAEDNMQDDLENLISIVKYNHGEIHCGGEGSCRWDLEMYDEEKDRQQVIKDDRTMCYIWKEIQKEQNAKYTLTCKKCGYVWYYSKKPKYEKGYTCCCGGDIEIKKL